MSLQSTLMLTAGQQTGALASARSFLTDVTEMARISETWFDSDCVAGQQWLDLRVGDRSSACATLAKRAPMPQSRSVHQSPPCESTSPRARSKTRLWLGALSGHDGLIRVATLHTFHDGQRLACRRHPWIACLASAWKSADFLCALNAHSDNSQPFCVLRSLQKFLLSE